MYEGKRERDDKGKETKGGNRDILDSRPDQIGLNPEIRPPRQ